MSTEVLEAMPLRRLSRTVWNELSVSFAEIPLSSWSRIVVLLQSPSFVPDAKDTKTSTNESERRSVAQFSVSLRLCVSALKDQAERIGRAIVTARRIKTRSEAPENAVEVNPVTFNDAIVWRSVRGAISQCCEELSKLRKDFEPIKRMSESWVMICDGPAASPRADLAVAKSNDATPIATPTADTSIALPISRGDVPSDDDNDDGTEGWELVGLHGLVAASACAARRLTPPISFGLAAKVLTGSNVVGAYLGAMVFAASFIVNVSPFSALDEPTEDGSRNSSTSSHSANSKELTPTGIAGDCTQQSQTSKTPATRTAAGTLTLTDGFRPRPSPSPNNDTAAAVTTCTSTDTSSPSARGGGDVAIDTVRVDPSTLWRQFEEGLMALQLAWNAVKATAHHEFPTDIPTDGDAITAALHCFGAAAAKFTTNAFAAPARTL